MPALAMQPIGWLVVGLTVSKVSPEAAETIWPPIRIDPVASVSRPAARRSSVDFPQPEGPTRLSISPGATVKSMSVRTGGPS